MHASLILVPCAVQPRYQTGKQATFDALAKTRELAELERARMAKVNHDLVNQDAVLLTDSFSNQERAEKLRQLTVNANSKLTMEQINAQVAVLKVMSIVCRAYVSR
jgi:hypothetical protein